MSKRAPKQPDKKSQLGLFSGTHTGAPTTAPDKTSFVAMGHKVKRNVSPKSSPISPPRAKRSSSGKPPTSPPGPPPTSSSGGSGGGTELDASLGEETRRRYLNYAVSVITSRALPDVRDGLKPVQRRILFAMIHDENLWPDAKHRKSAKVVGAVIGKYHPHGDTAVYDAMVRMAQDFAMRAPLVDGSGNFGSLDGDAAAAYRYTECRIAPPAAELLRELKQDTVNFRPNYDGTAEEPVVLPARFPNLLVNGSTGIAVGMATNIPPHNLKEVTSALVALIGNRDLTTTNILKYIKGPDFPTGGQMLNSKLELREIYDSGHGAIRVRAEYKLEERGHGQTDIVVTSIPYAVTKSSIVEKIADVIIARKLQQLVDVRDESTTDVRVVLEIKKDADPTMVMAYLFKHTPLQLNFNMNMTALIPVKGSDSGQPERMGIKPMLEHFLDFRFDVIRRRFNFELRALKRRIHILEGFVVVFDALDETIRIIRRSEGRKDALAKLMKRFSLDEVQISAVLDLRLYKLAKLEILVIREELADKQKQAQHIEGILKSDTKLWGVVKTELQEMASEYGNARRTKIGAMAEEIEFDEDVYILDEDAHVVVTTDGWIKRVREIKSPTSTRLREGDAVLAVLPGSTKEHVVFFTNFGTAYVIRIVDITPTTGYGDPAQKLFKFKDGEKIITAMTLDPRAILPGELLAISARGFGLRFDLSGHLEATTRAGRKYARPGKGDEIIGVCAVSPKDTVVTATFKGHVLVCKAKDINKLEGAGKGVTVLKTGEGDRVVGFIAGSHRRDTLELETTTGTRKFNIAADPKKAVGRGGKGTQIVKRSTLRLIQKPVTIVPLATADGGKRVH